MSKQHNIENYYLVPQAPHCIYWEDFLLLPDPRFPCQDLQEDQWKKTMAYAQALQYLLAGSILELQKVMELYILFSDDIVLGGMALLEGFLGSQTSVSTDVPSTPPMFHLKK